MTVDFWGERYHVVELVDVCARIGGYQGFRSGARAVIHNHCGICQDSTGIWGRHGKVSHSFTLLHMLHLEILPKEGHVNCATKNTKVEGWTYF